MHRPDVTEIADAQSYVRLFRARAADISKFEHLEFEFELSSFDVYSMWLFFF